MYLIENWTTMEHIPPPGAGELHLWRLDLDQPMVDQSSLLSSDERQRGDRFLAAEDRQRFIQARAGLRRVLGQYLATDPTQLCFGYGEQGKPFLQRPSTELAFNLSHSQGLALLAVTTGSAIGIDLEQPRLRLNLKAIARRLFDPAIQQELAPLKGEHLAQAFYRHWTLHEARIKALGEGIFHAHKAGTADLACVNLIPQAGWLAAVAMAGGVPDPTEWKTCRLQPPPHCA
jgi:4'-phosphopantetheinyl transferase